MTIKGFVRDMIADCETYCAPQPMSISDAAYNLTVYRLEGRKLPARITPANFAAAWNAALPVDENSVQAEAQGILDALSVPWFDRFDIASRLMLNMQLNGHTVRAVDGSHFEIDSVLYVISKVKGTKAWKVSVAA